VTNKISFSGLVLGACAWQLLPLPRAMPRSTKRKTEEMAAPTAKPTAVRGRKEASAVPNLATRSSSTEEEEGAGVTPALEAIDVRHPSDNDESTDEEIIRSLLSAMVDRVRDIYDGLISVEEVADAAQRQMLVKRPLRESRVNFILSAKAAFLHKLKEGGGFKEGSVEGVGDCMFISPQAYHEIENPAKLDAATRDQKVTSLRTSIVQAIGAGNRKTSMVPLPLRQAIATYYGAKELKVRLRLTDSITPVRLHPSLRAHRLLDVSRALS
jgi:hypothetical protein